MNLLKITVVASLVVLSSSAGADAITPFTFLQSKIACMYSEYENSVSKHDDLWNIVSTQCVPGAEQGCKPKPCAKVDLAARYAILKDKYKGPTHYLLIPTDRVTGIEEQALLQENSPNYWEAAWNQRRFIQKDLPRERVGLAINAIGTRSKDQLHIHMNCVNKVIPDYLKDHESEIGTTFSTKAFLPLDRTPWPGGGPEYRIMKIEQEDLHGIDPFKIIAGDLNGQKMRDHSLAVIGATFADGKKGFYLLDAVSPVTWGHRSAVNLLSNCNED